ncbi:MAG: hypothetical protein F6K62_08740 [Sphaerospermopsis sp. SIO1G2]|nr:hypothetical protein [Sphaerospermopsis sp. SIO1G2]
MKSFFVRWGLTLSLVGGTLFGGVATVTTFNQPALALTDQQVKAKLDSIPVFVVTNDKGLPLSRTLPTKNGIESNFAFTC